MRATGGTRAGATTGVRVRDIEVVEHGGLSRVRADVDGAELWFEAAGRALRPSPEAFASALLVPALRAKRPLVLDAPLSRAWLAGSERLNEVFSGWWGYRRLPVEAPVREGNGTVPSARTALCFSAGADSFHTLLRSGRRIDLLVSAHGFDVPLADAVRWDALEASIREVSAAVSIPSVVIRTNLREHPLVLPTNWEHSHGGALAAVGHLLSGEVGRLLVSSSIQPARDKPWGSHWTTDPFWSSPELAVVHYGETVYRSAKIREICREPLVEKHLHVCWENRTPTGNCSACVKCLRTVLVLLDEGVLDRFPGFAPSSAIAAHVDAMPVIEGQGFTWREVLAGGRLPPEVHRAVAAIVERTDCARRGRFPWLRRLLGRASR